MADLKQTYTTGIVIPCYNEAKKFALENYSGFIHDHPEYLFCFVNDGSTDGTADLMMTLDARHANAVTFHLDRNSGKAEAIRAGMRYILNTFHVDFVAYIDADLSAPLSELKRFVLILEIEKDLQLIFGSRVLLFGKEIERSSFRHYSGRIVATMISLVLRTPIYDTQCGLKVFRKNMAICLFEAPFISKWLFDVELFARIRLNPIATGPYMREEPLKTWIEKGDTKIRFADLLVLPRDLFFINRAYSISTNKSVNQNIL